MNKDIPLESLDDLSESHRYMAKQAAIFEKVEYYAAHALTGLLSNPQSLDQNYQKYLEMKKLSIEKLAILSAMSLVEELTVYRDQFLKPKGGINAI